MTFQKSSASARTYVSEVLKRVAWNMKNDRTFESLELEIDDIVKTQEGEHELQINCELWTEQAKQLRELIEYDKVEFIGNRKKKIEMAQQMNAEVDNSIFLNGSQLGEKSSLFYCARKTTQRDFFRLCKITHRYRICGKMGRGTDREAGIETGTKGDRIIGRQSNLRKLGKS